MARIRLKHVAGIIGRDGKVRYYFRRRGHKNVPLPGLPGSEGFMSTYAAAIGNATPIKIGASRAKAGTIAATVGGYLRSAAFAILAPETRRTRRNVLERFREQHGDKPVALIERKHVQAMVDGKAATPSAARNFLNTVRALMKFSMETGIRPDDPTIGVKRVKIKTTGYATWTEDDITRFETKHPSGTRARLALALLLYTGQRRSDVVRLGRQHIRGGVIYVRQQKTAAELAIPIHAQLRAVLDATPSDHLTFLTTAAGKPFTAPGFTNWFREKCKEAEIPKGLSAHGLRKAACRRLAEAGCSANEIAAISGHATLREVERYTRAADQARMARAAIGRLAMAVPDAENKTRR
jgi:integrase